MTCSSDCRDTVIIIASPDPAETPAHPSRVAHSGRAWRTNCSLQKPGTPFVFFRPAIPPPISGAFVYIGRARHVRIRAEVQCAPLHAFVSCLRVICARDLPVSLTTKSGMSCNQRRGGSGEGARFAAAPVNSTAQAKQRARVSGPRHLTHTSALPAAVSPGVTPLGSGALDAGLPLAAPITRIYSSPQRHRSPGCQPLSCGDTVAKFRAIRVLSSLSIFRSHWRDRAAHLRLITNFLPHFSNRWTRRLQLPSHLKPRRTQSCFHG